MIEIVLWDVDGTLPDFNSAGGAIASAGGRS